MNLKMIDLFSGIGSFRLAFKSFGVDCVFSADFDKNVAKAYEHAYSENPYRDINEIDINSIPDYDILTAGFPCQPFSVAGHRLGFQDPRTKATFKTFEIIQATKPKAFILENVKGLNKKIGDDTESPLTKIINLLTPFGYHIEANLYNANYYSHTPQNRERYFIIGIREDLYNGASLSLSPLEGPPVSFKDILLPKNQISDKYFYHLDNRPNFNSELYSQLASYESDHDFSDYVYQIRRKYIRKHTVKYRSPTLTKNMGTGGHNVPIIYDTRFSKWRKFTPKECFRLQDFPEDFPLLTSLSDSALYAIAGNSIPLNLTTRIAKLVLSAIKKN